MRWARSSLTRWANLVDEGTSDGTILRWASSVWSETSSIRDTGTTLDFSQQALFSAGSEAAPSISFSGDPNTGLYWWGADAIGVTTGGTRKIWIGPQTRLYGANPLWLIGSSGTSGGINYLSFYLSDETTRSAWIGFGASGSESFQIRNERAGDIKIVIWNGTASASRMAIVGAGPTTLYDKNAAESIRLDTGYVRLGSGVALQFNGTTVPRLEVGANNSIQVTNASGWLQVGPQNASWCHVYTDRPAFYFNKGASFTGDTSPYGDNVYNLGSSTSRWATVYRLAESSSSDRRIKRNISDSVPGLSFIEQLRPRRFRYRNHTDEWWWGFIAQEVADVVDPSTHEVVHVPEEGPLGLNYEQLIAPLVRATQELSAKVKALEDKL